MLPFFLLAVLSPSSECPPTALSDACASSECMELRRRLFVFFPSLFSLQLGPLPHYVPTSLGTTTTLPTVRVSSSSFFYWRSFLVHTLPNRRPSLFLLCAVHHSTCSLFALSSKPPKGKSAEETSSASSRVSLICYPLVPAELRVARWDFSSLFVQIMMFTCLTSCDDFGEGNAVGGRGVLALYLCKRC